MLVGGRVGFKVSGLLDLGLETYRLLFAQQPMITSLDST